jgi:HK97 family phage major capsid protein
METLEARQSEIKTRLEEIDTEFAGLQLPDETRAEWNDLNTELEANRDLIAELRSRQARVEELRDRGSTETPPADEKIRWDGGGRRPGRVPDDLFDVPEYRSRTSSQDDLYDAYKEGARRVLETASFPHQRAKREDVQEHVDRLIDKCGSQDGEMSVAERILKTGSPTYRRAFGKTLAGQGLTTEEQRTLSLTSTAGGLAVPYVLDPTVIPTGNGVVNPLREISRVETITGNNWLGVTAGTILAAYSAEVTQTVDNAPVLAQPSLNVEKAQAFVPFSIEIGQDWGSLESEMSSLFSDAKDALEADKFVTGLGHGSNVPQGLLVGGTSVVTTAATATFAVGDLSTVEAALPPRFRPNAKIVTNRAQLNRVRAFDQYGGAALWVQLGDGLPGRLIGYPTYELSTMVSTITTGSSILTIGDFSKFLIVDRVGMNVELIPHLLVTTGYPVGQRGLYCYWRNTAGVLAWQAFRTLKAL